MNKLGKLVIIVATFLVATFVMDVITGLVIGDNPTGLALLANSPYANSDPLLTQYFNFFTTDTLGWFTSLFTSGAQSLELIGGGLIGPGGLGGPSGYIPILVEYHLGSSQPQYFVPYLMGLLKLVVPMITTGIMSGLISASKKDAMVGTLSAFLVIGAGAIILNIIHVYLNWVSYSWKFTATTSQNPLLSLVLMVFGSTSMGGYLLFSSIIIIVYAVVNGVVMAVISAMSAAKK
ncbi:MAG: hypothetical protein ACTSU9_08385 [Promethearchaeota archaeon]